MSKYNLALGCRCHQNFVVRMFRFKFLKFKILQAFAWFSDLLADHSEIFWSLYSVDLDAALDVQPPDSWDAFPLFQMLNDFLLSERKKIG